MKLELEEQLLWVHTSREIPWHWSVMHLEVRWPCKIYDIEWQIILMPFILYSIIIYNFTSGIPPPRLTWSRSGRLIDDSFTVLRNGTVRNEIQFRTIDRSFLHAEFTCTATNTNLSRPVTSTVHVDMNCKFWHIF